MTRTSDSAEVVLAKRHALSQLRDLIGIMPVEQRARQFRDLLRRWHPDKNPDEPELATAVFQFLQKGKGLLHLVKEGATSPAYPPRSR